MRTLYLNYIVFFLYNYIGYNFFIIMLITHIDFNFRSYQLSFTLECTRLTLTLILFAITFLSLWNEHYSRRF
jgi:hypothetical protein